MQSPDVLGSSIRILDVQVGDPCDLLIHLQIGDHEVETRTKVQE